MHGETLVPKKGSKAVPRAGHHPPAAGWMLLWPPRLRASAAGTGEEASEYPSPGLRDTGSGGKATRPWCSTAAWWDRLPFTVVETCVLRASPCVTGPRGGKLPRSESHLHPLLRALPGAPCAVLSEGQVLLLRPQGRGVGGRPPFHLSNSLRASQGASSPTPGNSNQVPREALLLSAALPPSVPFLQTQIHRPNNGKWLISKDTTHKVLVACCLPVGK